ncbi:MAG: lysophospholipid acyltransferase family protein [Elusimicrobiales bacterium]
MKKLIWTVVRTAYSILYNVEVKGLENIPKKGRVIIAANHLSNNDPPVILSHIAKVRSDFGVLAKKELFENPVFACILEKLGAIKTDRSNINISSIKKAISILNRDGCLMIFPEGTRKREENQLPRSGVLYLLKKTNSDVLPAKISYMKNGSRLGKIIIVFGSIISATDYDLDDEKNKHDFPKYLMKVIYSLK